MERRKSASNNMRLISLIGFCAIATTIRLASAEEDVNIIPTTGQTHEPQASLTSDAQFFTGNQYSDDNDVESISFGGNMSIGSRSGRLYNYDDYMGQLDVFPDGSNYDYGECIFSTNFSFPPNSNDGIPFHAYLFLNRVKIDMINARQIFIAIR